MAKRSTPPKSKAAIKKALDAIARAAKRKEQKEQGAFDGRFPSARGEEQEDLYTQAEEAGS